MIDERTAAPLDELFRPRSVAVVGASNRPGSVGESVFRNILRSGYRGVAYPVNPSWRSVSGVQCFPSVPDLPEPPELGVVIVPAAGVAQVVEELAERGTRGLVVISAGFREIGPAGAALEADLVRTARKYRISLVGPNCFGVFNTDPAVSLNATFSEGLPPSGNIAFVSQSGALGAGILEYAATERIGFSRFVSVGNRAGIDECDLLAALAADDRTRVILLYVESLASGRRFLEAARAVTGTKPVVVIKSGRTPAGERAARSHTGSLARSGRDRLFDAIFEQSGVLRVDSLADLFRTAKVFSSGIRLDGPRLAILTNSGGPGIVAADAAVRSGLALPALDDAARGRLAARLPSIAAVANPVDMTADVGPEHYTEALRMLLAEPTIDGALVISTPTGTMPGARVAQAILEGRAGSSKAVVACLFGLTDLSQEMALLERSGVPAFTFPEEAVAALGSLARYHAWQTRPRTEVRSFAVDRDRARRAIEEARAHGAALVPEAAARALLSAYGIAFPRVERVRSLEEGRSAAARIGFPVVLKVASPDISHKTDVGGVVVGIDDADALGRAWERMTRTLAERAPTARLEGFEIHEEIRGGKEVLVGVQRDPDFGPIIAFGLGGIYVEILQDVTFRLAPLVARSAQRMVESVRAYPLLAGVRGERPSDLPALEEAIERVAQLAVEWPEIAELDLNPLIVRPAGSGVVAVDARVVLAPPGPSPALPDGAPSNVNSD